MELYRKLVKITLPNIYKLIRLKCIIFHGNANEKKRLIFYILLAHFQTFSSASNEKEDLELDKNLEKFAVNSEEIIYPFQQYIQVRKEYTVEHLPYPKEEETYHHQQHPLAFDESQIQFKSLKMIKPKPLIRHDTERNTNFVKFPSPRLKFQPRQRQGSKLSSIVLQKGRKSPYRKKTKKNYSQTDRKAEASSASTSSSQGNDDDDYDDGDHSQESAYSRGYKPRLTEEIENYKKQEVYEEKGYNDGAYDHGGHGTHYNGNHYDGDSDKKQQRQSHHDTSASNSNRALYSKLHRNRNGHSTPILQYAASNFYDKDAHRNGIYAARDHIHCPEVIDFDLSSKAMKMGEGETRKKPRLSGLGSKIKCLKEKYFGKEPLPSAIFLKPEESRNSIIEIPTFEQFFKGLKKDIRSVSDFKGF